MAIHVPGQRYRYSRLLSKRKGKREVVALLSLTAMVDMFTVLVVFLLQNYNTTGAVINIPKEVVLPKALQTKELKPSIVVTISSKEILLDTTAVASFDQVKAQEEWMIPTLSEKVKEALLKEKQKFEAELQQRLRNVVSNTDGAEENPSWSKVTVQADKGIDFLTVKKVMYTVTEAGASEINFAVMREKTPSVE